MPINLTTPRHGFSQTKITSMRIDLDRSADADDEDDD